MVYLLWIGTDSKLDQANKIRKKIMVDRRNGTLS